MKVIKNNYKGEEINYPLQVNCYYCESILEIETPEDCCYIMQMGKYFRSIHCPCCGNIHIMNDWLVDNPENQYRGFTRIKRVWHRDT